MQRFMLPIWALIKTINLNNLNYMKNSVISFVCAAMLFAGVACSPKTDQQTIPDRAFYDVSEGAVKEVSNVVGVKEDKSAYIVAENAEPMLASCLLREGAQFSQDGVLLSSQEPVRDSLGRIVSFREDEKYVYCRQELRPALYADDASLLHYIYKGKSVSPLESLCFVFVKEGDKMVDLVVWNKRYEYIEKDGFGNWTKRKVNAYMGTLNEKSIAYYASLCDINLSADARLKLEEELRQELRNPNRENIAVESYMETESRTIEYYE